MSYYVTLHSVSEHGHLAVVAVAVNARCVCISNFHFAASLLNFPNKLMQEHNDVDDIPAPAGVAAAGGGDAGVAAAGVAAAGVAPAGVAPAGGGAAGGGVAGGGAGFGAAVPAAVNAVQQAEVRLASAAVLMQSVSCSPHTVTASVW